MESDEDQEEAEEEEEEEVPQKKSNKKSNNKKGEILPTDKKFDSNTITPGTDFMVRLDKQLRVSEKP